MNPFSNKSFLSVNDLSREHVSFLFQETDKMKKIVATQGGKDLLKGKVIACVFYEPSSRTFSSFVSASQRLGAGTIQLLGMSASSVAKGETLEDTIRTFACYADAIVMRHPEVGSAAFAAKYSYVPVINAGDGKGEHPTQAILDAYTIHNHFSSFTALTVGMIGDLLNGRTVHSLSKLLAKLGVKKFIWVAPSILRMPEEIYNLVKHKGTEVIQTEDLKEVIGKMDVLYVTRVQKERFTNQEQYEELKHKYIIAPQIMKNAKKNMILMHPLPRVGEITNDVDQDKRAVYIKEQMTNGVYTRMALLKSILS